MTQLTYQAALDPFHAVFRLLRLRTLVLQVGPLHLNVIRVLDFYLLFPFRIDEIRLPRKHSRFKSLAKDYEAFKPYGVLPDSIVLFERMEPMEMAALETTVNRGFFRNEAFTSGMVVATNATLPDPLNNRILSLNQEQSDLMIFLAVLASEYPLNGENGLKARTGLLEYRYDTL